MFAFFRITFQWCQSGWLFIAFLARAFVLQTIALGVKVKPENMNENWKGLCRMAKLFMLLANTNRDFIFLLILTLEVSFSEDFFRTGYEDGNGE